MIETLLSARAPLVAHAHPDDETLATGALLAHLAATGRRGAVVTATRGERGEVRADADLAGASLVQVRRRELRCALEHLGVTRHTYLAEGTQNWRDSGMRWIRPGLAGPAEVAERDPAAFTAGDVQVQAAQLAAQVRAWECDALVSYDDAGTYGHPDHVQMHHVARAAARAAKVPFIQVRSEETSPASLDAAPVLPASAVDGAFVGLPQTFAQVRAALGCYATQLQVVADLEAEGHVGVRVRHVGGQLQDIWCGVAFTER
ncbi:MAG: PIG-L family deacetylase [Bowdeniella nasicola]|nr:PIG-L family deacetylase [Bowdeniella nasicola]